MIPSQTDIVLRLAELSRLLDAATVEVAVLDEEAVRAKQAFEVASARAYLTAEGPVDARSWDRDRWTTQREGMPE